MSIVEAKIIRSQFLTIYVAAIFYLRDTHLPENRISTNLQFMSEEKQLNAVNSLSKNLPRTLLPVHAICNRHRRPPFRFLSFPIVRSVSRHFEIFIRIDAVYWFPDYCSLFPILEATISYRPTDGIYLTHVSLDVVVNDYYYFLIF